MDEVLAAEVLHSSGNVSHELDQHLRWEVLQDKKVVVTHPPQLTLIFCTAGGTIVSLFKDM